MFEFLRWHTCQWSGKPRLHQIFLFFEACLGFVRLIDRNHDFVSRLRPSWLIWLDIYLWLINKIWSGSILKTCGQFHWGSRNHPGRWGRRPGWIFFLTIEFFLKNWIAWIFIICKLGQWCLGANNFMSSMSCLSIWFWILYLSSKIRYWFCIFIRNNHLILHR